MIDVNNFTIYPKPYERSPITRESSHESDVIKSLTPEQINLARDNYEKARQFYVKNLELPENSSWQEIKKAGELRSFLIKLLNLKQNQPKYPPLSQIRKDLNLNEKSGWTEAIRAVLKLRKQGMKP